MPSTNDHSRLSGDVICCTLAFLSIILLASVPFALAPRQHSGDNASVTQQAASVQPVSLPAVAAQKAARTTTRQSGVDLLAFVGLNGDKSRLYELSTFDRNLYKQIFAAQDNGDWRQANALIKRLHDRILLGHVLYDRYINSADYKASYEELRDWMVHYNDHPNAFRVYQLAQKRRNNAPEALPAPQIAKKLFGTLELAWLMKNAPAVDNAQKPAGKKRNSAQIRDLVQTIKARLSQDRVTSAYNLLGSSPVSKTLTAYEYDSLLSEIASAYYYNQKYDSALKLANQAIRRSKNAVPTAHWIAGLSSWQKGEYAAAAKYFEAVNQSHSRNPWMLSAGAFWAARAYNKLGKHDLGDDWLREAASYSRTFYGFVAQARLGSEQHFSWNEPELTAPLLASLRDTVSGRRALALLDAGETTLAQQELLQTHPNGNQRLAKALVAVAHHFKLPALAMRLGNAINQPDGNLYDVALYPVVPWKGDLATGVDPALINALIRQESKFEYDASNRRSGATGLMQLMPRTAEFVSDNSFNAKDLHNPEVNVALGQRYVRYLLGMQHINGNMLYMVAAYNAGPGTLSRWLKNVPFNDDPFLFIESLPWSETRGYIARVMTNYWVYTQRFSQDTSSLASLSKENWPHYTEQSDIVRLASNF